MDSPVIVDTGSKFGRNLDLGFPFDDESFGRRSDIRSHLDNLAARHPEFADHLLGSAWGDIPFNGSLRRGRRGSGSNSSQHHSHQDEDARSQASGSSAASAASGASGVSSHGEPEPSYTHQDTSSTASQKLPHYGLRNTVDIGQHNHNMMNQERGQDSRGQRSMSAPPENRQTPHEQPVNNQNQQSQNPRFVSRVDITNPPPPSGEKVSQQPQQSPPNQGQKPQQQSNVRHIPIFVEGRDTPVVPKNIDEPIYRQQSPPRFRDSQFDVPPEFHSPPQFQRPSHFNQHFGNKHNHWPNFQDGFGRDTFDHPGVRRTTQQTPHPSSTFRQQQQPQQQNHFFPNQSSNININNNSNNNQSNCNNQQQDSAAPEPPKRKQIVPKDALERVSLVQQEIDSLNEQVKLWSGTSRQDKQYIYLDEMLTRELIKLDDIDTEGKENVRQARKNAIKSIQDSISLLESKAPLGEQQEGADKSKQQQPMDVQTSVPEVDKVQDNVEKMEIEKKPEDEEISGKIAIPLPPGPTTSPIQLEPVDNLDKLSDPGQNNCADNSTPKIEGQVARKNEDNQMIVDSSIAIPLQAPPALENSGKTLFIDGQSVPEINHSVQNKNLNNNECVNDDKKSPKRVKKAKKQTPVSTEPIPLPPPETHQT